MGEKIVRKKTLQGSQMTKTFTSATGHGGGGAIAGEKSQIATGDFIFCNLDKFVKINTLADSWREMTKWRLDWSWIDWLIDWLINLFILSLINWLIYWLMDSIICSHFTLSFIDWSIHLASVQAKLFKLLQNPHFWEGVRNFWSHHHQNFKACDPKFWWHPLKNLRVVNCREKPDWVIQIKEWFVFFNGYTKVVPKDSWNGRNSRPLIYDGLQVALNMYIEKLFRPCCHWSCWW